MKSSRWWTWDRIVMVALFVALGALALGFFCAELVNAT